MSIRQKIYLAFLCVITMLTLLILFVFKPLFVEIKNTAASTLESREKLIALERMDKKYIEEVEKDYEIISGNLVAIKKQLVGKSGAVGFFEAMETAAESTNNKIEISASEFPILTLSVFGTFSDLMKFLGWLENGDYFIGVESINIARVSVKEDAELITDGRIKTNIKIKIYLED